MQFSQTKWWPKLKVVRFGRFNMLSNGVDNTLILFFKKWNFKIPLFKQFNLKKSLIHTNIRYSAGLSSLDFFNYPANPVSSRIVKTTIRCIPTSCILCYFQNWRSIRVLEGIKAQYCMTNNLLFVRSHTLKCVRPPVRTLLKKFWIACQGMRLCLIS